MVNFWKAYKYQVKMTFFGRMGYSIHGYPIIGGYLRSLYFKKILKKIDTQKINNVLDLGCGTADFSYYLAELNPNLSIDAIDSNDKLIQKDRVISEILEINNIHFISKDFFEFNLKNRIKYNLILSLGSLIYFSKKDTIHMLNKTLDWLKPGGYLILFLPLNNWFNNKILNERFYKLGYNQFLTQMKGYYFSRKNLINLLENRNLKVIQILDTSILGRLAWELNQICLESRISVLIFLSIIPLKLICLFDILSKDRRGGSLFVLCQKNSKLYNNHN